jgi:hypothetical protein
MKSFEEAAQAWAFHLWWSNQFLIYRYGLRFDNEGRITYGWPY